MNREKSFSVIFSSEDKDKIFVFKNPISGKKHFLQVVSVECEDISEVFKQEYDLQPNCCFEKLWYRLTPDIDSSQKRLEVYTIGIVFNEKPAAVPLPSAGDKDFGDNAHYCCALKPERDFKIEWRLVVGEA